MSGPSVWFMLAEDLRAERRRLEEELARVTAENARLREALRRLVRAAGELYMEGSDGDEDEYAAAYELAEAALASPVQEENE